MVFLPSCLNETTSSSQTPQDPPVFRAWESVFQLPISAYITHISAFTPTPSCKKFSNFEARVILLYYFPSFMCQLSNYCLSAPKLHFFALLWYWRWTYKHFFFASQYNVKFCQQRALKGHSQQQNEDPFSGF